MEFFTLSSKSLVYALDSLVICTDFLYIGTDFLYIGTFSYALASTHLHSVKYTIQFYIYSSLTRLSGQLSVFSALGFINFIICINLQYTYLASSFPANTAHTSAARKTVAIIARFIFIPFLSLLLLSDLYAGV